MISIRHLLREAFFIPAPKVRGAVLRNDRKHIQMAIVVDEYGGVAGIVSMEDLLEPLSATSRTNLTTRKKRS